MPSILALFSISLVLPGRKGTIWPEPRLVLSRRRRAVCVSHEGEQPPGCGMCCGIAGLAGVLQWGRANLCVVQPGSPSSFVPVFWRSFHLGVYAVYAGGSRGRDAGSVPHHVRFSGPLREREGPGVDRSARRKALPEAGAVPFRGAAGSNESLSSSTENNPENQP